MKLADGKKLVDAARKAVALHFEKKKFYLEGFSAKAGVFVSILTFPNRDLRGCIGFAQPLYPLNKAVVNAALAAAFNDPRFPSLKQEELNKVIFEVSVLTHPKKVDDVKNIKVGRDGLIAKFDNYNGLLLPHVFAHYKCSIEQALSMTCDKAGLPEDYWRTEDVVFYSFQAEVFSEKNPCGDVTFSGAATKSLIK